ncbi:MAG: HDOD domain-containing protein, partial [Fibrobacterota bacterium]
MNNILLISSNKKEEEVLKLLLEQSSFKVISSIPDYANYLKILQFKPRLILIEMPSNYVNQISYMKMVRRNKNTRKTPIISFGSHSDKFITNSFVASGSNEYISRPLKAKDLLEKFQRLLRLKSLPSEKNKNEEEQELSEIMLDENKAGSEKINAVVSHVDKVLAFPFTVAKLLKISSSEESGASDLAKVIKSDPVITAKILKVCNSVLFATRNNKTISDVKKAI